MQKEGLPVELELQAERANALALSAERLQAALHSLAQADAALAALGIEASAADRDALRGTRTLLRVQASERLWFLLVQREALGLTSHEPVFRIYGVPAEVRQHAGPRPARYRAGAASVGAGGPGSR